MNNNPWHAMNISPDIVPTSKPLQLCLVSLGIMPPRVINSWNLPVEDPDLWRVAAWRYLVYEDIKSDKPMSQHATYIVRDSKGGQRSLYPEPAKLYGGCWIHDLSQWDVKEVISWIGYDAPSVVELRQLTLQGEFTSPFVRSLVRNCKNQQMFTFVLAEEPLIQDWMKVTAQDLNNITHTTYTYNLKTGTYVKANP